MPEPKPRKIDIELSFPNDATVNSLINEIQNLRAAMGGQSAKGGGGQLNRGGEGKSSPQAAEEQTSAGDPTAQSRKKLWQGKVRPFLAAESQVGYNVSPETEGLNQGHFGGSRPPKVPPPPEGAQWWQERLNSATGDPIELPRFGEFTIQDTLNMASNALGSVAVGAARKAGKGGPSIPVQALGATAGAFDVAAQYSPYAVRAAQHLGLPSFNPLAAQAEGQAMGLQRARRNINIGPIGMQLPGSQFFGEAGSTILHQNAQAVGAGLSTPGVSAQGAKDYLDTANQFGWASNQGMTDRFFNQYKGLKKEAVELPEDSITMALQDDMIRRGGTTFEGAADALRSLADGAEAANMNIDEFGTAVQEFATTWGTQLTTARATEAVSGLSGVMDMSPESMSTLMQNPYFQSQALGEYGYTPQNIGLLAEDPQAFSDVALKTQRTLDQSMRGVFKGRDIPVRGPDGQITHMRHESARDQSDPYGASYMDMTLEEYQSLRRNAKKTKALAGLEGLADQFYKQHKAVDQSGLSDEAKIDRFESMMQLGSGGKNIATKGEIIAQMKASPILKDRVGEVAGMSSPNEIINTLRNEISAEKQKINQDRNDRPLLDLTRDAKRLVRELGLNPPKKKGDEATGPDDTITPRDRLGNLPESTSATSTPMGSSGRRF